MFFTIELARLPCCTALSRLLLKKLADFIKLLALILLVELAV